MTARVDGPYCAIHDAAHRPCDPCDPLDAGVISSDAPVVLSPADADRVAALIEERPGPTEAMRALFAERRPCAGWEGEDGGPWRLMVDNAIVITGLDPERGAWFDIEIGPIGPVPAASPDAAKILAEDALRAIAAEILRAVGS